MKKNRHLTVDECREIEHLMREQTPIREIASRLGISMPDILREARIFERVRDKFDRYRVHNNCARRGDCGRRSLCDDRSCTRGCSMCDLCNELCDDFTMRACFRLYESPYCCDGCDEEYKCALRKVFHLDKRARDAYLEKVSGPEHGTCSI